MVDLIAREPAMRGLHRQIMDIVTLTAEELQLGDIVIEDPVEEVCFNSQIYRRSIDLHLIDLSLHCCLEKYKKMALTVAQLFHKFRKKLRTEA